MGCSYSGNRRIWRLLSSYYGWTDNSGVYDVVRNRYLCTSSRFSFSAEIAKNRVKVEEETQAGILGDEEKTTIRNKIDEIEKLIKEVHTLLGAD